MELIKVISGGQTGVDIAALRAASAHKFETGGTCPYTNYSKNVACRLYGVVPLENSTKMPISAQLPARSRKNVDDADGTLAFSFKKSIGTDATIRYAKTGIWGSYISPQFQPNPLLIVTSLHDDQLPVIVKFLNDNAIRTLNVCGHRDIEYETPVEIFLRKLFLLVCNNKM